MSEMGCAEVRHLLPERAARELRPVEREALDEHLAGCEDCALENRIVDALRVDRPPVPPELQEAIREALERERERFRPLPPHARVLPGHPNPRRKDGRSWAWRPATTWAAAAAVVLALGSTLLWRGTSSLGDDAPLQAALEATPSVWPADDGMVAGAPLMEDLSDLTDEDLEVLLTELEG